MEQELNLSPAAKSTDTDSTAKSTDTDSQSKPSSISDLSSPSEVQNEPVNFKAAKVRKSMLPSRELIGFCQHVASPWNVLCV